jgi:hypothetical protein
MKKLLHILSISLLAFVASGCVREGYYRDQSNQISTKEYRYYNYDRRYGDEPIPNQYVMVDKYGQEYDRRNGQSVVKVYNKYDSPQRRDVRSDREIKEDQRRYDDQNRSY